AMAGSSTTFLQVSTQANDAAYPPVARWDWDPAHHEQYIGIKCGVAWCEVGSQQFAPAPALTAGPSFDPVTGFTATTGSDHVYTIKGWYDEQQLAVPAGDGLAPGACHGVLMPKPFPDPIAHG